MILNHFKNLINNNYAISRHTRKHYVGYWLSKKYSKKFHITSHYDIGRIDDRPVVYISHGAGEIVNKITGDTMKKLRGNIRHIVCYTVTTGLLENDEWISFDSEDEAREFVLSTSANAAFRNFLFSRVIPNLSRIGLLTDKIRPKFEALGLLEYENAPDDFECDWNELKKPLEKFGEIPEAI